MVSPVSHATHAIPVSTVAAKPKAAPADAASATAQTQSQGTKVTLSAAAQALAEAKETPAQTAQEAARGDMQAKRLEAREEAAQPHAG
ncbi:MAG: hypothetical protein JOY81_10880 [Alphaproteobacteria bacterium]|nr:hypothetical protein [Alphaproteobacteria bacterium]